MHRSRVPGSMPTNYRQIGRMRRTISARSAHSGYAAKVEHVAGIPDVLSPARLGPLTLRNRVIKAATYEGLSHRSRVTTDLVDFHRAYAAGGVGMTTVAYCAVAPEGRTAPDQILWTDEAMPGLRALTDAVHDEGAAISAQIGHAGPVADPRGNGLPALSPSTRFPNISGGISRSAKPADLERITARPRGRGDPGDRGGLRRRRGAPRPQLPRQRVPEPEDQPPHRRVRRLAAQPREVRPRDPAGGARRGRRPDRDPDQAEPHRRRARRHHRRRGDPDGAVDRAGRHRRRPGDDRRAARCSTRCTCSRAAPRSRSSSR